MADLSERAKTDIRMPRSLLEQIDEAAEACGLSKNAFFAVGAARLCAELAKTIFSTPKRVSKLKKLQKTVNELFDTTIKEA